MTPIFLEGATREMGPPRDWDAALDGECVTIYIKDVPCLAGNVMFSAWRPDAEEIARILLGQPILLAVLGTGHPPVMVHVGEFDRDVTASDMG